MISVGVNELQNDISELLQRVLEDGETIEVTLQGESVARVIPTRRKLRSPEEVAKELEGLEKLSELISAHWQGEQNAVEVVREQRREL